MQALVVLARPNLYEVLAMLSALRSIQTQADEAPLQEVEISFASAGVSRRRKYHSYIRKYI
jgi:hypothetical protein